MVPPTRWPDTLAPLRERVGEEWTWALLGGLVSMALAVGFHLWTGAGDTFSLSPVVAGGVLAGYLAASSGGRAARCGLYAGALGALPAVAWIAPAAVDTFATFAGAWSSAGAAAVVVALFLAFGVGVGAVLGLLGGVVGGWLARKRHGSRVAVGGA